MLKARVPKILRLGVVPQVRLVMLIRLLGIMSLSFMLSSSLQIIQAKAILIYNVGWRGNFVFPCKSSFSIVLFFVESVTAEL